MTDTIVEIQLELIYPKSSRPDTNTEMRYRVLYKGEEIGAWTDPEHSAARWLVDQKSIPLDAVLHTYRGSMHCMTGTLGWYASHYIREDDAYNGGAPTVVKWKPSSYTSLKPETIEKILQWQSVHRKPVAQP